MKKIVAWIAGIAITVLVIDWAVVGLKLLNCPYCGKEI